MYVEDVVSFRTGNIFSNSFKTVGGKLFKIFLEKTLKPLKPNCEGMEVPIREDPYAYILYKYRRRPEIHDKEGGCLSNSLECNFAKIQYLAISEEAVKNLQV